MSDSSYALLAKPIQHALWDMRWDSLRPIQSDAIRLLLTTDHDALISARTASGKTEAAFLPILSRLYEQPGESIGAIYVGPLKALINDQFRRLEDLCARAEIPVHRWHGDVDGGRKEKALRKPRGVLLITPESLESFFVNRPTTLGRMFRDLRFAVIDEIHSLVGRERGLQLRSQLFRLQRYTAAEFRLIGLSATVGDAIDQYKVWMRPSAPAKVAYIHDPGEQKQVLFGIQVYQGPLPIKECDETAEAEAEMNQEVPPTMVDDIVQTFCGKKNLIFCNRRQTVEWLADSANQACGRIGRPPEFLVHHGSLSKEIRYFTEEQMREARPATAVCSATLELGIDIGNVSAVGQIGPAWSVSSQIQRLGRSGRRDGEPHCMRILLPIRRLSTDEDLVKRLHPDLLQAIAISELMRRRWVEPPTESQYDLSTLVQQILSSLAERGGIEAAPLYEGLVTQGAFREMHTATFVEILRSLGQSELIEQMASGLLLLAPKGEEVVHDREFYSAFASAHELTVRYEGRAIGTLSALYLPQPGDHFLLGGRRWQTIEVDEQAGEILVKPSAGRRPPKIMGGGGDIHRRVREEMKAVVSGNANYEYLIGAGQGLLTAAREVFQRSRMHDSDVVPLADNSFLWFTWTGTQIQRTLMHLATAAGLIADDWRLAIKFNGTPAEVIDSLLQTAAETSSAEALVTFVPTYGWRKFDSYLSEELLRRSFAVDWLDLDGAKRKVEELQAT